MRQAIVKLLIFAVVFALLDRTIFAAAIYLRDHASYYDAIDMLYERKFNPAVAFFGDSRTHRNYDMSVIEADTGLSAYNFGIDGIGTRQSVLMLDQLLRNQHHPQVIVLEADPTTLNQDWGVFNGAAFRDHLATTPTDSALTEPGDPRLSDRVADWAAQWLARTASLPNRLPYLLQRWRAHVHWVDMPPTTSLCVDTPELVLRCVDYHGSTLFATEHPWAGGTQEVAEPRVDAAMAALYQRAVALAQQHDTRLLLAETPRFLGDTLYSPEDKARTEAFYCGLAQDAPHVLYARLAHVDGIDRNRALYYDGWHFNVDGARVMSRLIAPLITALARGERPEPCIWR